MFVSDDGVFKMELDIAPDKTTSPFLALPGELRNRIYDLVLIQSSTIVFEYEQGKSNNHFLPPLLRSCRQIRKEASPVYFQGNTFEFFTILSLETQLQEFVAKVGTKFFQLCTSVTLLGGACSWCPSYRDHHVVEINFQLKTVKQSPTNASCDADDSGVFQPVMQDLPHVIEEFDLETATDADLERLVRDITAALKNPEDYFWAM